MALYRKKCRELQVSIAEANKNRKPVPTTEENSTQVLYTKYTLLFFTVKAKAGNDKCNCTVSCKTISVKPKNLKRAISYEKNIVAIAYTKRRIDIV